MYFLSYTEAVMVRVDDQQKLKAFDIRKRLLFRGIERKCTNAMQLRFNCFQLEKRSKNSFQTNMKHFLRPINFSRTYIFK